MPPSPTHDDIADASERRSLPTARRRHMWQAAAIAVLMVADGGGIALASTPQAAPNVVRPAARPKTLGPAEAPNAASARLMAKVQKRRIEILAERTDSTSTFANPDGTTTLESFTGPIRAKDEHGNWAPIDMTLVPEGGKIQPRQAAADVELSDGGTGEPLAAVDKGKHSLGVAWEGKLPKPKLHGPTATYENAVPGGDLVVTALKEGFTHNVVLRERPKAPVEYRLPIEADGLTLKETADKRLRWDDTKNKAKATAPAPVMWGAAIDKGSGEPEKIANVDVEIETGKDGKQVLVLKPSAAFLNDPNVKYPVTIDPTDSLMGPITDTWIQYDDYLTSQRGSTELKAGTYDGVQKARSFLQFNVDKYKGKQILDAKLRMYSYYSSTCNTANAGVQVRRVTAAWDPSAITWANQPATTATGAATIKDAKGYSSSCPAGSSTWDIDAIAQSWADGQANYGLRVASADEADPLTWRRYRSANYVDGSHNATYEPSLTINYNTKPGAATPVSPLSGSSTNDTTPTLTGKATDPDGNTVQLSYEIWAANGTAALQTGKSAYTASGSNAPWTPTTALAPGSYKWRAAVYDGNVWNGTWSAWQTFTVDTTKPSTTAVGSTAFPAGQWSGTANSNGDFSGNFTFTPPSSDVKDIQYKLDSGTWTTAATTGAAVTKSLTFRAGKHVLTVHTRDAAGNVSADVTYTFYAGSGAALLAPAEGDRPASRTALLAQAKPTDTGVRYQYRRGETDAWKDVPVADVRIAATGATPTAWPVAVTGGTVPELSWNITQTLAADGPVDVRAVVTDGSSTDYSPANTVTVDRAAGAAPDLPVGPGDVNALTGDLTLAESDATVFGMSVTRAASSRRPALGAAQAGQAAIFGPEWASGTELAATESNWATVQEPAAGLVTVTDGEGKQTGFTATTGGGFKPEPGAEGLVLSKGADGSYTLKDTKGVTSTFTKATGTSAWQLSATARPTDDPANPSTFLVSTVVTENGKQVARPKYLVARTSAVTIDVCKVTPSTKGCRVLEYVYAAGTTATDSALGDYAGRVQGIRLWATNPGAAAATATDIASYQYDKDGRLREVWDPRVSPAQKKTYDYDAAGRVVKYGEPGILPWTLTYGKVGTSPVSGDGMLLKASHPTLTQGSKTETNGTAATSVVYGVPLSGAKAPYAMGATDVAAWSQSDVPTDATALFPADQVPSANDGDALAAGDYKRAVVTYTNASGRQVNTAQPGGFVSTTEHDAFGNEVRELTAANRALALGTSPGAAQTLDALNISELGTAERSDMLSSVSVYSADGVDELDTLSPLKLTGLAAGLAATADLPAVAAGTEVAAREHTRTAYDEGRPTDGSAKAAHLETKKSTGIVVTGYPEAEVRTLATGYDWAKGLPTSKTDDPSGLALKRTTGYDGQGRPTLSTVPASDGTDASASTTVYWTAGGTGDCSGRPEWADLVCKTAPVAKVTGANGNPDELPTVVTEYDRHGQVAKRTETANGSSQVITTTFDAAGRPVTNSVSGPGAAVQTSTTTYDPANGQVAKVATADGAVTTEFDALGRVSTYTDAEGATTSTEYDALDRTVKTVGSAPYTTTYEYDTNAEPRGLATKVTDSGAGVFTNKYDADGNTVEQTLPGGVTMRQTNAPGGETVNRTYTLAGQTEPFFASAGSTSVHGQLLNRSGLSVSANTYDAGGRLVTQRTEAQDGSGTCAVYSYTYDANGSKKTEASATGTTDTGCPTSAGAATSHAYDSAGRIVDAGYQYDARGRLTASPDGLSSTYFANDRLQSQTAGTRRQTWTLDPLGRKRGALIETNSGGTWASVETQKFHYDSSDQLVWTQSGTAVTRTLITDVADLNGLAAIDADGTVTISLNEASDDGQIQYTPATGEFLVRDSIGDLTVGTNPADQITGQESVGAGSLLSSCPGCSAAPLSAPTAMTSYSASRSKASKTDTWLFHKSLWTFKKEKQKRHHHDGLIWKDNGCSAPWLVKVSSAIVYYYSSEFRWPCARHDFGYRNYQDQHRKKRKYKDRIDTNFKKDMKKYICEPKNIFTEQPCKGAAEGFYYAVHWFGDDAFGI
ncbi:phospholipase A2 [Streptomyces sp. NRRL S-87]|uniref:phospholipase A2 n=1 Tax=Streptomyces sp. NRRL S-87 TaxID=1463920 RepID=UPI0022770E7B|nr:phospholipase A2 [Streptomyces sp. NRRL S-87]